MCTCEVMVPILKAPREKMTALALGKGFPEAMIKDDQRCVWFHLCYVSFWEKIRVLRYESSLFAMFPICYSTLSVFPFVICFR